MNYFIFDSLFVCSSGWYLDVILTTPPLLRDLVKILTRSLRGASYFFLGIHIFQKYSFGKKIPDTLLRSRRSNDDHCSNLFKTKNDEIINENLSKIDEIQNLVSVTSKMTSWPQKLWDFFQKLQFQNQCIKLRKMSYTSTF